MAYECILASHVIELSKIEDVVDKSFEFIRLDESDESIHMIFKNFIEARSI